jgi:predicted nucleotidyltransferase
VRRRKREGGWKQAFGFEEFQRQWIVSLLTQLHEEKRARRERLRLETRARCRELLGALLPPGTRIVVFGSLAKPYAFSRWSDVDLAVGGLPSGLSLEQLAAHLEAELGRPVDVVRLGATRINAAILRTGESWTL